MQNDVLYNKIMSQIGSSGGESPLFKVQYVIVEDDVPRLDKTWKEIDTAIKTGKIPYFIYSELYEGVNIGAIYYCYNSIEVEDNTPHLYSTLFMSGGFSNGGFEPYPMYFIANSEDDYPHSDE